MVFHSLFRRTLTCIKPKSFRAIGSPAIESSISHLYLCTSTSGAVETSTSTAKKKKKKFKGIKQQSLRSVDSSYLIRILNSEIKFAQDSDFLHCDVGYPEDFPFTVKDFDGWKTVALERKYQEETITVLVDIPTSSPAEHSDDDGETDREPVAPLAIMVSKENGLFLQFEGKVSPGRIFVDTMTINKFGNNAKDGIKYAGPDFLKLKGEFQKAIHDYLEIRGLTSTTADFVLEYMIGKDAREYLQWLRNLKAFIEQKHHY